VIDKNFITDKVKVYDRYAISPLSLDNMEAALLYDLHQYLISDVLALTDAMSMAQSIEVRVPYMDNSVVGKALSIPAQEKIRKGRKWLLKDLLNKYNGYTYTQRMKEGFGTPLSYWLKQEGTRLYIERLLRKEALIFNYIHYDSVANLVSINKSNKKDVSNELWSLILLNEWLSYTFE
jgi:asparagine synthase (glutamine-hydrolysing)